MERHKHLATVMVAFAAATVACGLIGCTKEEPQPAAPAVAPSEKVAPSPVGTSQTVLDKTFPVKATSTYAFEIPPHAAMPHLHGMFASFTGQVNGASDDSANIDFLILNQDQEADFANNRPSDALFTVEASHNQSINYDLPASLDHPVKYYLVFRNPDGKKSAKLVEATFRVDF